MAMTEIKLVAAAGEYMESAAIIQWLKKEGDPVQAGEAVVVVETAKAAVDIEAPASGVLHKILAEPGTEVPVGHVLGLIAPDQPSAVDAGTVATEATNAATAPGGALHAEAARENTPDAQGATASPPPVAAPSAEEGFVRASPRARFLARELGIDLATVKPTGPGGRVVERDVVAAARAREAAEAQTVVAGVAAGTTAEAPAAAVGTHQLEGTASQTAEGSEETRSAAASSMPFWREKPTGYRRASALHMARTVQVPQFSVSTTFDASELERFRAQLKDWAARRGEKAPSVTAIMVKAAAAALKAHPRVNAQWDNGEIIYWEHANIGVAVATSHGLVVPVVHRADEKGLAAIRDELARLQQRAEALQLTPRDLENGTFTISNLGMMGIEHFTPIVNTPQAAILAVSAVKVQPVWVDGSFQPRPLGHLTLTADHRVLDGADAAQFLAFLKDLLEHPAALLMGESGLAG